MDKLQKFQLARLEYALERVRIADGMGRTIATRCAASLYNSCVEAGVKDYADTLVNKHRIQVSH